VLAILDKHTEQEAAGASAAETIGQTIIKIVPILAKEQTAALLVFRRYKQLSISYIGKTT
jgi:hypothetical protein